MKAGMEQGEHGLMEQLEGTLWWYAGLHANVLHAIGKYAQRTDKLLDAGCGTGGMLQRIGARYPDVRSHGLDLSEYACQAARTKTGALIVQGSVDALPYLDKAFDTLVSLDVLGYEMDVDAAVAGFHRVLRPGGVAIINLAAYQWMLSYHDKAVGQSRRYTRSEVIALFRQHGFVIRYSTYWNTLLFPLMVLQRKVLGSDGRSDVRQISGVMNNAFKFCLSIERLFTRRALPLPFGGSILLIVQRPTE
ncbi:MAG: class I SAM-dependent methyltransferase [Flavobacteriales bacterium]|nr:class I SAM-dependent methyltransferase [Flavobacteriales bacterium]